MKSLNRLVMPAPSVPGAAPAPTGALATCCGALPVVARELDRCSEQVTTPCARLRLLRRLTRDPPAPKEQVRDRLAREQRRARSAVSRTAYHAARRIAPRRSGVRIFTRSLTRGDRERRGRRRRIVGRDDRGRFRKVRRSWHTWYTGRDRQPSNPRSRSSGELQCRHGPAGTLPNLGSSVRSQPVPKQTAGNRRPTAPQCADRQ